FLEKSQVELPAAFMKRWLLVANEGKYTAEQIDKEFDGFLDDFKWQCVRDFLAQKFEVKVEREDLLEGAKAMAAYQFAVYGMYDVPQEQLENYAGRFLSNEEDSRRIAEQVEESKVLTAVKTCITLDTKDVTLDEFRALSTTE
ncbi:MAG: trigger factor, partial [Bacteroidales bacterium]|nr:trigger factor [Bacteroidales bacterium]